MTICRPCACGCGRTVHDTQPRRGRPRLYVARDHRDRKHHDDERKLDHELGLRRPRRPCPESAGCDTCDAIRAVS